MSPSTVFGYRVEQGDAGPVSSLVLRFVLKGSRRVLLVEDPKLLSPELARLREQQPFDVDVRGLELYGVGDRRFLLI